MPGQKHIIEKCVFDLAFPSEKQALEAQKVMPAIITDQLLGEIDRILSGIPDPDETLLIEKLELDLGQIDPGNLPDQLSQKMLAALDAGIRKLAEQRTVPAKPGLKAKGTPVTSRVLKPDEQNIGLFFQFLDTGNLPRWAGHISMQHLEKEILNLATVNPGMLTGKLRQLNRPALAASRLVCQFTKEFNTHLAGLLIGGYDGLLSSAIKISELKIKADERVQAFEGAGNLKIILASIIWEKMMSSPDSFFDPGEVAEMAFERIGAGTSVKQDLVSGTTQNGESTDARTTKGRAESENRQADEAFFIGNSGLVLLWPYMENFFHNLGLVKDGKFCNRECQEKALLISRFLTTGKEEYPEHEMILNKVLTGWPLNETFRNSIKLPVREKSECANLLTAVIKNWTALKNTSIEGLREGFLSRDGKLSSRGEDWLLQVERRGIDILLEQLPWPADVIRLPWISYLIYIEW